VQLFGSCERREKLSKLRSAGARRRIARGHGPDGTITAAVCDHDSAALRFEPTQELTPSRSVELLLRWHSITRIRQQAGLAQYFDGDRPRVLLAIENGERSATTGNRPVPPRPFSGTWRSSFRPGGRCPYPRLPRLRRDRRRLLPFLEWLPKINLGDPCRRFYGGTERHPGGSLWFGAGRSETVEHDQISQCLSAHTASKGSPTGPRESSPA
jgi:hypothetical protein